MGLTSFPESRGNEEEEQRKRPKAANSPNKSSNSSTSTNLQGSETPSTCADEEDSDLAKDTQIVTLGVDEDGNKMINEYTVIRTLGSGSYGKVKLCIDGNNRAYAIKILNKSFLRRVKKMDGSDAFDDVRREIAILKRLRHPNVVRLFEVIDAPENDKLFLVMEYIENGPVLTIDESQCSSKTFEEDEARSYMQDIISGLEYLHGLKIIHRDIKPENLLLDADNHVKLSDFGVSAMYKGDDDTLKSTAGTPAFLSPEACGEEKFSGKAADIWAVGVTLYIFIFGKCPFTGDGYLQIYNNIQTVKLTYPKAISPELQDLFYKILDKNPKTRITLSQLKKHPWVLGKKLDSVISSPEQEEPKVVQPFDITQKEIDNAIIVGNTEKALDKLILVVKLKSKFSKKIKSLKDVSKKNEESQQQEQQQQQPSSLSSSSSSSPKTTTTTTTCLTSDKEPASIKTANDLTSTSEAESTTTKSSQ